MRDGEKERGIAQSHVAYAKPSTSSPSHSQSLIPSHSAVSVLVVLTTFVLCIFPLMDTDLWWHLRTGQLIWERGDVPRSDWFLFSDSNRPWIDLHWGFQLLVALLYSLSGVELITLLKAFVISAAVGVGWFASGRDLPAWFKAAVWIPALICISGRGYERPEIFSQLFLALWLWVAFRVEHQPRWIWALPVIQVLWVNCHSLFALGLVIGACFAVDYFLRAVFHGRFGLEPLPAILPPRLITAAGAACGFAALINPYLLDGALFPLVVYRKFSAEQEFYSARIGEFQRPFNFLMQYGFVNIYLNAEILLALIAIISFVTAWMWTRRWSPFRLLAFTAFLNLAWEASRNSNIFSFVAAIIAVANFADVWRAAQANRLSQTLSQSRTTLLNLIAAGVFVLWIGLIGTNVWGLWSGEQKWFALGERPWWFGHEAVRFAGQPGFPDRAIASHIGLAATYEFHNGPERKVLLDPRLEVCTQKTFELQDSILQQMSNRDRTWEILMRDAEGNLPVVILDSRGSRPMINGLMITPGWRLVYADPAAAVFLAERQADALKLAPADPSPLIAPP